MNGVRSIYRRKGYLLTALAAAVLLAASSGTAWAQSVGFVGTSATVGEGASPSPRTADPVTVEINVSGLTLSGLGANGDTGVGVLTIQHDADAAYPGQAERVDAGNMRRIWLDSTSSAIDEEDLAETLVAHTDADKRHLRGVPDGAELTYDNNGVITLVIIDPGGDGNWVDDSFTMRLVTSMVTGNRLPPTPVPGSFKVTVMDNDPQATVSFSKSSLSLTEGSETAGGSEISVVLTAGVALDPTDDPDNMGDLTNNVQFTASPANAVVFPNDASVTDNPNGPNVNTGCDPTHDRDVISLTITDPGITYVAATGVFTVSDPLGALTETASFEVEACGDKSGYQDGMVTFSFVERSLTGMSEVDGANATGLGDVAAGNMLTVTVQSSEPVPTVQFGTSSLRIDEGSTETVAILADSATGAEVESVMVGVSGYAMISLWQDDEMLEADADGNYDVDLMGSANTILTVSADSDAELEDGMTSMATLTIISANGANIGDGDSVSVTVNGSTAVPALPLLGQLLLALFLMAGGARLYRRRQG